MKKISTLLFALMLTALVFAQQTRTLQPVAYRGAFEPNAARWTDGWTNFNPNAVNYDSIQTARGVVIIKASITKNTTWLANKVYQLEGPIYVKNGFTLTIQPGCVIRGNANVSNSCLIVSRGGKINAVGTASNPIVFTSSKANGQRNLGDWGGVIILGKARINAVGGVSNIEGLAASSDNEFGGTDDEDNSGSFAYCRIEFGGYIFSPDKEINGLTMGGVGRKTRIDHVQTSFINDDAFEWFGGTVNCSHLVAYQNLDDDLDTDLGYSGTVQFALVIRNKTYFDPSNNSTSEGFESDNDPDGSSNSITPRTSAIFSNITLVGPYRNDTTVSISSKFQRALRIRRASNLRVVNSVFTDFPNGIHFDGDRAAENSLATDVTGASAACRYNVFATIKNKSTNPPTTTKRPIQTNSRYTALIGGVTSAKLDSLFDAWNNTDFGYNSNGLFADNINQSNFDMDYRPGASSPLASGANFTDAFIEPRTRIGLGAVNIAQDTFEIGNISSASAVVFNVGSIANADSYNWSVPKGVTIVSGQGTTTLTVNFDDPTKFATTIAKPVFIYCQASNNASLTLSTKDSVRIAKTKPSFTIIALTSNANNNLSDGLWTSTTTGTSARGQKTITVATTAGLTVGSVIKIIPGTGAGAVGNNNTVASIINGTSFTLKDTIPTTSIVANVVLKAYYFPQGTSTNYVSAAGASSTAGSTIVTVSSTSGLKAGMFVRVTAGTGTLKAGTVVAKVIDGTTFALSLVPSVALGGGTTVISGYPLPLNMCPIAVSTGFTSEVDFTVVAPNASNILGYRFDAPTNNKLPGASARISRVGSNAQTDYKTNRLGFALTSANNVGMVFDSLFTSGTVKVTPYNNAGLGKAFSVKVSKLKTGIFKVTSTAAAIKNTTVLYTAQISNGDVATSYKWTLPPNTTALSGTVVGNVVTTTTDTLTLEFGNLFKSGSLKVEAINACGTGTAKSFSLNGTTVLTKNGTFELAEENSEIELDYSLNVYPNPSKGSFKVAVNTESTSNATVTVLNLLGQVVYTTEVENNNGLIYTEINKNFEKGVYLIKVEIENDTKVNKMIVE
jgi:hypothetical protein